MTNQLTINQPATINFANTEVTATFANEDYNLLINRLQDLKIPELVLIFPVNMKFAVLKIPGYKVFIDLPDATEAYSAINSKLDGLAPILEYFKSDRELPVGYYVNCTTLDKDPAIDFQIEIKKEGGFKRGELHVVGAFKTRPGIPGFRGAVCSECGHKQFWQCRDVGSPSHSNCAECQERFDEETLFIGDFVPDVIQAMYKDGV